LLHVCDRAGFVSLESSQDFEGRRDYSDGAIVASEEEALGAGANAAYLITFEKSSALLVGRYNLADLEEIECLPLRFLTQFLSKLRPEVGACSRRNLQSTAPYLKIAAAINSVMNSQPANVSPCLGLELG
jgi:hypothetical protein